MSETERVVAELNMFPVADTIARHGEEIFRRVPIRGGGFHGHHMYEARRHDDDVLHYCGTCVCHTVQAPKESGHE